MLENLILRPFRGEDDDTLLAGILTASENADSQSMTVSAADLGENFRHSPNFDILRDLVIAKLEERVVAFGRVRWENDESPRRTYVLSAYVLPEFRRKGIGQALMTWLEARARVIAGEQPCAAPAFLHINATQFKTGLHALARQADYGVKESWALMVRPNLEDIPDTPLPEGLEIRPALPGHFAAIWYAMQEAYVPEGGPPPTGEIPIEFSDDSNFQPDLWQVAWEVGSGKVVGSVMTDIFFKENEQLGILRGYTEGISTVPAWQRRGVAKALITRSLKTQPQAGMKESALICSGENHHNMKVFTSCGFQEVKRDTVNEKLLIITS